MVVDVFAYGSLQIPALMHAVSRRRFVSQPALLRDHRTYRLRERCYPGLRHRPGACTEGVLYRGVDRQALRRLDRFEDDFYRRRRLPVAVDSGKAVPAEVYLIPPQHYRLLEPRGWSLQRFRRCVLKRFLRASRCRMSAACSIGEAPACARWAGAGASAGARRTWPSSRG